MNGAEAICFTGGIGENAVEIRRRVCADLSFFGIELDDELNKKYEKEAEAERDNFSDEFRKQDVLEKVLFCYDKKSWKGAKKMAKFLYEENEDVFGGGYKKEMTEEILKVTKLFNK